MIKNQREELNLQLASQLLQFSNLIKESADSLSFANPYMFSVSNTSYFEISKLVEPQCFTIYEFMLYDAEKQTPTYLIRLTYGVDFVETELRRYKRKEGVFVELYLVRGGLVAPSLTTLKVLVSNIHITSAVSLFSEGLRLLGFEGKL